MPKRRPEIRVARGPDFAEVAEALGVSTYQIMAASWAKDGVLVLFTPNLRQDWTPDAPDADEQARAFKALLKPDADNILRPFGPPTEVPRPGKDRPDR